MNNRGQAGAWEGIIILILIVFIGGLVFLLWSKKTDSTVYQDGSKPKVTDISPHPSFGGCASIRVTEYIEAKQKAQVNNAHP